MKPGSLAFSGKLSDLFRESVARGRRRSGGWHENKRELRLWLTIIVVVPGLVFFWSVDPFFLHAIQSSGVQPIVLPSGSVAAEDVDEEIYLEQDDADFMNRIFSQRMNEIAYCGLLDGKRMEPWLADTLTSSPDRMTFSTKNCPGSGPPGALIHTHPSGSLGLSFADRAYFTKHGLKYMCVQGGQLETDPGQRAAKLACYKKVQIDGSYEFLRVPVIIRG